jgi:hypothetical protein
MSSPKSYIDFIEVPSGNRKTKQWTVVTVSLPTQTLGIVHWYPRWRQYVFEPYTDTVYSSGCLADVERFLKTETDSVMRPGKSI